MTAKEAQRMQRLEAENRELREKVITHIRVYGEALVEIVEMRAKLELIASALHGGDE